MTFNITFARYRVTQTQQGSLVQRQRIRGQGLRTSTGQEQGRRNGEKASVAGWENSHTHTHDPSMAEDVIVVVAGVQNRVGSQLGRGTVKEQADGWSGTGR